MLEQMQNYIIPLMACICFLTFIFVGRRTTMKVVGSYFFAATMAILTIILLEIAEPYFKEPNYIHPNWQRWVISIAAYILRPIIAYVLILILERDREKQRWFYPVITLPLALNTILLLLSPLCGIVYYFDDNNIFVNGPMRLMPFLTGFLYLAIYFVLLVADMRRNGVDEDCVKYFV